MAITDKLRAGVHRMNGGWCCIVDTCFDELCDRIDAEHERQMAERRRNCVFYEQERNYCKVHDDGDMAELGYVRLPKDADGEPIRIGDTVEWLDEPHHPITVVGVGKNTLFYIDDDANAQWTMAITKRHHAKTVEDMLREMLDAWGELPSNATNEAIIAEYAAKLRELVRDLMPIVCEGCHERLCEMPKEEHPFVECLFDYRMRELGIEVDDA